MDNLDKDLAEMQRLGYSSYGKYKLDYPTTKPQASKSVGKSPKRSAPPKIHQLTCAHCGKAFTSKTSYKKYCSDSCYKNASQQHYRARIAGTRVKTIGICQICGASFQQLRSTQKYCSKECNAEGSRRNQREWRARLKEAKQCSTITK